MIRKTLFAAGTIALLLPHSIFAYDNSADLLRAIESDSNGRNFWLELHANQDDTYTSVWLNGAVAGKEPTSMKGNVKTTIDVFEAGQTIRTRGEVRVTDGIAYYQLKEAYADGTAVTDGSLAAAKGQWVEMPLTAGGVAGIGALPLQPGFGAANSAIPDLDTMGRDLLNASFNFERRGFPGGNAYHLELRPDFILKAASILEHEGLVAEGDAVSHEQLELLAPLVGDMIKAKIKVDTNEADEFQYAQVDVDVHMDGAKVNGQLISEVRDGMVYVVAPANAVPFNASLPGMYMEDWPSWIGRWQDTSAMKKTVPTMMMPKTMPAQKLPAPTVRRSTRASMSQPATCTASPGTAEYIQQTRKGLCTVQANTRPGRGTLRN